MSANAPNATIASRMRPEARALDHAEQGVLLGQLALVLAPQARALPVTISALLVVLLFWRWLLWRRGMALPSRGVLAVVAVLIIATAAALAWQAGGNVGRDLSVALLGAFVILKLLETRVLGDATVVIQVSFYLLLSLYLFDQPFWLAGYSVAVGAWTLRNWLFLQHPEARDKVAAWPALGRLALVGLPWALLLFVLFPRLEHPLWRLPTQQTIARTGMSDAMSPGSVGELIRSNEVAMRVALDRGPLPANALYWRALVLSDFDGKTWRHDPAGGFRSRDGGAGARAAPELESRPTPEARRVANASDTANEATSGAAEPTSANANAPVEYAVTLEPTQRRWLYVLDRGQAIARGADAVLSDDGEFLSRSPVDQRMLYRARSAPPLAAGQEDSLTAARRLRALALPAGNPRSRELAAQWRERYDDPWQRVQAALRLFHGAPFRYTLSPAAFGNQQIDSFLFDSRSGFCEHYAGGFVFLMRAAGVPARVVLGYQGGEYNPIARHYIVRQADAHAWAEVWLDGRGWVRVDPTGAVAPSRIDRGIDALFENGAAGFDLAATGLPNDTGWLRDLRWGVDGMTYTWHRWVLEYDYGQQASLMRGLTQLGLGASLTQLLLLGLGVLALASLLPLALRTRTSDPVAALYGRFCRALARRGCVKAPDEGPLDFATRAAAAFPAAAGAIDTLTARYVDLRYGAPSPHGEASALAGLRRALRELRVALRRR